MQVVAQGDSQFRRRKMKRFIATLILMGLTICSVASMMMRPVKAEIVVFTAQLLASNEVPPITNDDRNTSGSAIVTLDTVAHTARFDFSLNGVASPQIILAHIHEGPAGVNGPIRVDSLISPASPLTVVNGSVVFGRSGLTVPTDVQDRLLANPAGFYFNVHSTLNPGGVARGQLVRAQATPTTAAPTLSEWGLILMTLLFIAAGAFFLVGRNSLATAEAGAVFAPPAKAIDWRLLAKVALAVEAIIAVASLALSSGAVDVLGALSAGLLISFILHLLIGRARSS
jgi:cbb3-type cytochrome oxidase subunit 3